MERGNVAHASHSGQSLSCATDGLLNGWQMALILASPHRAADDGLEKERQICEPSHSATAGPIVWGELARELASWGAGRYPGILGRRGMAPRDLVSAVTGCRGSRACCETIASADGKFILCPWLCLLLLEGAREAGILGARRSGPGGRAAASWDLAWCNPVRTQPGPPPALCSCRAGRGRRGVPLPLPLPLGHGG